MTGNIDIANTTEARSYCETLDAGVKYYNNLVSELKNARAKISSNWEGDATAISDVLSRIDQVTAAFEAALIPAMSGLSNSVATMADEIDKVANNTVENSTNTATPTTPSGTANSGNAAQSTVVSKGGGGAGNIVGGILTGAGVGAGIGAFGGPIGAGIGAAAGAVVGGIGSGFDGENTFENAFWSKHGNNFAEAWTSRDWTDSWDYSECESVIDVVGQTADGLIGSVSDLAGALIDTGGAAVNFVVDGLGELLGGLFG